MTDAPEVPAGTRIYAVGDIHGRVDLLEELHERIKADRESRPIANAEVVYLGDYVDRGPASKEVVGTLVARPLEGFRIIHLKGNHEDFLLRFHDSGEMGESWLMNGGGATLASYGVEGAEDTFHALWRLKDIRSAFRDTVPPSHLAFFNSLMLNYRLGGYLFVHAGLRPGRAIENQSPRDMMWIRDEFLFSDTDFGAVIVHGHTPRPAPVVRANRIGIDTMAYRTGQLTALVLEGPGRRFLVTGQH